MKTERSPKVSPKKIVTICHRVIMGDPKYFPSSDYKGKKYYFCTEYCFRAFVEDPQRFLPAHSKNKSSQAKCDYMDKS